jgi:hypothetical protein
MKKLPAKPRSEVKGQKPSGKAGSWFNKIELENLTKTKNIKIVFIFTIFKFPTNSKLMERTISNKRVLSRFSLLSRLFNRLILLLFLLLAIFQHFKNLLALSPCCKQISWINYCPDQENFSDLLSKQFLRIFFTENTNEM